MSLFTDFTARGRVGILDWYTLSVAVFATVLLSAHGATYLRLKTVGPVHERSERLTRVLWLITAVLFVAHSAETSGCRRPCVDVLLHHHAHLRRQGAPLTGHPGLLRRVP